MQVWRNCQILCEETSDSSAFLNIMCLLKYVLNCEQHFSFFDPDYPTTGLTSRVYCSSFRKNAFPDSLTNDPSLSKLFFEEWKLFINSLY
jgi:hypothetical protein